MTTGWGSHFTSQVLGESDLNENEKKKKIVLLEINCLHLEYS